MNGAYNELKFIFYNSYYDNMKYIYQQNTICLLKVNGIMDLTLEQIHMGNLLLHSISM